MKVLLIGDSIRMDCQPLVTELLAGRAQVIGPEQNCGDSRRVLANLGNWLGREPLDAIHVNFGLHDLKFLLAEQGYQVPLDEYARNASLALSRLRELAPAARLVWATITPVRDECYVGRKEFTRCAADVDRYNAAALAAARGAGYQINDLHAVVQAVGKTIAIRDDGVHMTDVGNRALAEAVANCVIGR